MAHSIQTPKFGAIEYGEADVIRTSEGLPGFKELKRFLLIRSEAYDPIKFLQSLDDPMISFPLIEPDLVRSDFRYELTAGQRDVLRLSQTDEQLAYSIVTLGSTPEEASVNLFAPLVINTSKMLACQVILLGSDYSVTEPLLKG